jgi:hypothetical protein
MAVAMLSLAACRQDPQAKPRAMDFDKVNKDAARMEEKSRQRAERQRQQMLEKANKESEKQ